MINILSPFKHRSPVKVKLMNEILSKKLVPASKSQPSCLLRNHKEGKQIIDNDWNSPGQPRLLKDKDITNISDALKEESGITIGENELISIIKDTRSKNIEAAGLVPICATKNPSRTTVNNYKCVLASQASVSITTTAISKTNNRYTAENSLISAMAFLIVVASTHFILANEENDEIRKEMKDAPTGVKMLYDMVSKAHGNLPVIPIKTQYIYSSDDTVMYVFEGKGKDKDLFRLVSSKALKHAGTNSKYQSDDSNMMNGMRVNLHSQFQPLEHVLQSSFLYVD